MHRSLHCKSSEKNIWDVINLELLEQDEDKADQTVQLLHNFQEVSLRAIMQFCVLHYFTHYLCTHSLHSFTFFSSASAIPMLS
mmetsp:Transcript_22971/g.32987  ORF Transcript_22971/g.32987 Transcript_22971/m.32987 type:complete len:83 (+) Transcript_22971:1412-1660(+)